MNYKTCTHTYDSGRAWKSAAASGREFCGYHLNYRGRQMRMAQYRARHQSFNIVLPPLDSLCSIHSALSQVAEALAADMIDPRRAMGLLKALRFAKENLRDSLKDDGAHWHETPYLTEDAAACDNFEADYGLPEGLDLHIPPEIAFPPPSVILREERSDESKHPFVAPRLPGGDDRVPLIPAIPPAYVRDYTAEAEAAFESTPADIELTEIYNTQGYKAWERRAHEHQRSNDRKQQRRLYRANYERYAAEAKLRNIQRAAEKLLAERQAAEKTAAKTEAAQGAQPEIAEAKKPPTPAAQASPPTLTEVKKTA